MKPIKRAIIACWVMLVACFAIKLFGGNWFEVVCTNEHFLRFCDWVDGNFIARNIIAILLYFPSTFLVIISCSFCSKPNKNQKIFCFVSIFLVWCINFISVDAKSFAEIVLIFSSPIVLEIISNKKFSFSIIRRNWFLGIIGIVLVLAFQSISLITRNVGLKTTQDSILVTSFLMIDYYIMLLLYYLYTVKLKERK